MSEEKRPTAKERALVEEVVGRAEIAEIDEYDDEAVKRATKRVKIAHKLVKEEDAERERRKQAGE